MQAARASYSEGVRLDTYGIRNPFLSSRLVELREFTPTDVTRAIATVWADDSLEEHIPTSTMSFRKPPSSHRRVPTLVLIVEFELDD